MIKKISWSIGYNVCFLTKRSRFEPCLYHFFNFKFENLIMLLRWTKTDEMADDMAYTTDDIALKN